MHLLKILRSLSLGATLGLAAGQNPHQVAQSRDLYHQQVKDTAEALRAFNGGLAAGLSVLSQIYSTRQTVDALTAHMETVDQYSVDDSGLICNHTVESIGDLIDLLNLGVIKVPYAESIGQTARVKKFVKQAYRDDLYLLDGIYARLQADDQGRVEERFSQVHHAYEALLKATS